jgi:hypothetical protein
MLREGTDISIALNIDTFTPPDSQELEDRLRPETDLRIESGIFAAATAPGGTLPPDVVIYLLYTVAPLATSVFVNVLSSALWDAMNVAFSRQRREVTEGTFSIVKIDEEGRTIRMVTVRTSDREIIEDQIRQALEDD